MNLQLEVKKAEVEELGAEAEDGGGEEIEVSKTLKILCKFETYCAWQVEFLIE